MQTHIYTIKKSSFFLGLIFSTFFLSSFADECLDYQSIKNTSTMEQQTNITITKKTSLEELENIKKELKAEGFKFDYSNVVYNDTREIISISISYTDENNNTGNYSVSSQNPINSILITSNGNQLSIKSEGSSNQSSIKQGNSKNISEDIRTSREEHRAAMEKRKVEMEKRMSNRRQEMKERRNSMRTRMETERDSIFGDARSTSTEDFSGYYKIITKNSTDADLLILKENYDSENITFTYDQLQRDADDLITRISITVNNRNGSISTSSFGNGKSPIKDVSIGVDAKHIMMKNVE